MKGKHKKEMKTWRKKRGKLQHMCFSFDGASVIAQWEPKVIFVHCFGCELLTLLPNNNGQQKGECDCDLCLQVFLSLSPPH